ncbi:methyltransferase domain-containing protein [Aquicoccus sp. SCR17]|nr:methyltransferase domain-containing protein [Carideicomes alvinocaridis]
MSDPMSARAARWEALFAGGGDPWEFWSSAYEQEKFRACAAALPRRCGTALELGCAGGAFTRHLMRRCDHVLALDLSREALAAAQQRLAGPGVTFRRADLPGDWPAGSFDLVVFSEILYYFTPAEIVDLAARTAAALRPGGRILLVNWLGETGEPLSGAEAARLFLDACPPALRTETDASGPGGDYRLTLLARP